jgi:YlmC/YmxH family sporulation protein
MSKKNKNHNTISFGELRSKEVVNSIDGKRLGRIIDIVFGSHDGRILGIVVPPSRRNIIFKNSEPMYISWDYLERIGEDILLVRIVPESCWPHRHGHEGPRIDYREVSISSLEGGDAIGAETATSTQTNVVDGASRPADFVQAQSRNENQNNTARPNVNAQTTVAQVVNDKRQAQTRQSQARSSRQSSPNYDDYSNQELEQAYKQVNAEPTQNKSNRGLTIVERRPTNTHFVPGIDCDNKCSKCMLFDCSYRWNNELD